MAAYAGTVIPVWSVSLGNRIMSLVKFRVTNYNRTGIILSGNQIGVGHVEMILPICQSLADSNAPIAFTYDSVNQVCHCYKGANQEIDNDVNLYSTIGDMLFLVIGS
jgi:hypothetical protein